MKIFLTSKMFYGPTIIWLGNANTIDPVEFRVLIEPGPGGDRPGPRW